MTTSRRAFLETLAFGATAGLVESGCRSSCPVGGGDAAIDPVPAKDFRFTAPFDGGLFHEQSGSPVLGIETGPRGTRTLKIEVSGVVPAGVRPELFTADGQAIPVTLQNGVFRGVARLCGRVTDIRARTVIGGQRRVIRTRPVWVRNSTPRFRCYIDDHSFCFRDIARQRYKSLFDCFYFDKLRDLHRRFGVKINLNCFNTTPERDFSLAQFPDTYKSEFEDNAHWLRLAFHAENEFPDIPYQNATPEKFAADFDRVAGELKRIAGSAYTAGLQIHWADVPPDCYQVLADRGVKMLPTRSRKPGATDRKLCDYHLPDEVLAFLCDHQGWMHFDTGLIFYSASTGGCDWVPVDKIVPTIRKRTDLPAVGQLINIAGHEQYWWPFYKNFVPDIHDRYATAFRYVLDRGYRPVWIEDGFFGGAE